MKSYFSQYSKHLINLLQAMMNRSRTLEKTHVHSHVNRLEVRTRVTVAFFYPGKPS